MHIHRTLLAAVAVFAMALVPAIGRAEPVEVEVAYLPLMGIAPLFVMEGQQWTRAEDIRLKLTRFSSGPAIVQALASGKFDAVYMAVAPVLVARAAGIDLKIAAASGYEPHAFIALGPLAAAFAGAASPAQAFANFAKVNGRVPKIGSLPKGSMPDTILRNYLEQNRIAPEAIQVLSQGEEAVRQSLLAGAADGAVMPEPVITIIKERVASARVVADGGQLMRGHPGFVLAFREGFINRNPEAVMKLAAMNNRAVAYITQHTDAAADNVLEFFGKGLIEKSTLVAALRSPYTPAAKDLASIVPGTRAVQELQVRMGVQPKTVSMDDLFHTPALKAGGR